MSAPQTLDEKQEEKARLLKKYRAAKRAEWKELCQVEPRLPVFRRQLRRLNNPSEILSRLSDSWLRQAPLSHRYAALGQIDRHANRMAQYAGGQELDDPLPPKTNVYLAAREMLGVR